MTTDPPMSNAILVASLRGVIPDLRRIRERLLSVGAQAERGLLERLSDEQGVFDLYAAMATARELSRSGEKRIALVQSNLYYSYRPRLLSPHPERLIPKRVRIDVQPTATSIARGAFKTAKEAAAEDARNAEIAAQDAAQEGMSIDDIALGGIARRSMGVAQ